MYDDTFPGFFAHQVVNNACATLAVLNALLNIPNVKLGNELEELLSFTTGMDASMRGLAVTSSDFLREAHNALSPPSAVSLDGLGLPKGEKEDAYHFVVYVPVAGSLYELDGLKPNPVRHGAVVESGEGWVAKARCVFHLCCPFITLTLDFREAIEARIATYPPGSVCYVPPLNFENQIDLLLDARNGGYTSCSSNSTSWQSTKTRSPN